MKKKYIVWGILAIVAYVAWRKFGGQIKSTISSVTA